MVQSTRIQALAVFSGGGVKGVALAGAYAAAVNAGFDFKGFGGTSAGAIVACLASAGLSGQQMYAAMMDEKRAHPRRLFRDPSGDLDTLGRALEGLLGGMKAARGPVRNWLALGAAAIKLSSQERQAIQTLFGRYGLLTGESLRNELASLVGQRLNLDRRTALSLTFQDWAGVSGSSLRVVASDVSSASGIIFDQERTPGCPVIDAVAASASFPFAFQPREMDIDSHPGAIVLDGGLASNTPGFLFQDAFAATRLPTIVFQLKGAAAPAGFPNDLKQLVAAVVETAVNASDRIIEGLSPHADVITVDGCETIPTLGIPTSAQMKLMFNRGKAQRSQILRLAEFRRQSVAVCPPSVTHLGLRYGNPGPFVTALTAFRLQFYSLMRAAAARHGNQIRERQSDLRVALFVPEGLDGLIWKIAFHVGFGQDRDVNIAFTPERGCVGAASKTRDIAIDDTSVRRTTQTSRTGPTRDQLKLVPTDRRAVIACPVLAYDSAGKARRDLPVLAVLTIDSTLSLADAQWAPTSGNGVFSYVQDMLLDWSAVFARLLQS